MQSLLVVDICTRHYPKLGSSRYELSGVTAASAAQQKSPTQFATDTRFDKIDCKTYTYSKHGDSLAIYYAHVPPDSVEC